MPNIARLLREEIVRVARKEFRSEAESLKKSSLRYRSEIAALKRHVAMLERQVARLGKLLARGGSAAKLLAKGGSAAVESPPNKDAQLRFRADGFRKHRARLGISAPAMAGLLGVSAQTIYNWESGRSRPGKAQIGKIALVRKMGKRELSAKLQAQ